jgi:hypothetical protein
MKIELTNFQKFYMKYLDFGRNPEEYAENLRYLFNYLNPFLICVETYACDLKRIELKEGLIVQSEWDKKYGHINRFNYFDYDCYNYNDWAHAFLMSQKQDLVEDISNIYKNREKLRYFVHFSQSRFKTKENYTDALTHKMEKLDIDQYLDESFARMKAFLDYDIMDTTNEIKKEDTSNILDVILKNQENLENISGGLSRFYDRKGKLPYFCKTNMLEHSFGTLSLLAFSNQLSIIERIINNEKIGNESIMFKNTSEKAGDVR